MFPTVIPTIMTARHCVGSILGGMLGQDGLLDLENGDVPADHMDVDADIAEQLGNLAQQKKARQRRQQDCLKATQCVGEEVV